MSAFEKERTLLILKPDAIQRGLMGDILTRIERTGLKFVGIKFVISNREQALAHYAKDDAWCEKVGKRTIEGLEAQGLPVEKEAVDYGRDMLEALVGYLCAGPVLAAVIEGAEAVAIVSKLVGSTEPKTSDVGTIRGDLTVDSYSHANYRKGAIRNLAHQSESIEEAEREIPLWFNDDEMLNYKTIQERILYDVNFDGILE